MESELEWTIEPLHLKDCRIYPLKGRRDDDGTDGVLTPRPQPRQVNVDFTSSSSSSATAAATITTTSSSPSTTTISLSTYSKETVEFNQNAAVFSRLLDLPVSRVTEVQVIEYNDNSLVKVRYQAMKDKLFNLGYKKEVYVFHGTGRELNFHGIVENGFQVGGTNDIEVANGSAYGAGIYTALGPDAPISYSHGTAKVILALGLEGKTDEFNRSNVQNENITNLYERIEGEGREEEVLTNTIIPYLHPSWRVFQKPQQLLPVAIIAFDERALSPRLFRPISNIHRRLASRNPTQLSTLSAAKAALSRFGSSQISSDDKGNNNHIQNHNNFRSRYRSTTGYLSSLPPSQYDPTISNGNNDGDENVENNEDFQAAIMASIQSSSDVSEDKALQMAIEESTKEINDNNDDDHNNNDDMHMESPHERKLLRAEMVELSDDNSKDSDSNHDERDGDFQAALLASIQSCDNSEDEALQLAIEESAKEIDNNDDDNDNYNDDNDVCLETSLNSDCMDVCGYSRNHGDDGSTNVSSSWTSSCAELVEKLLAEKMLRKRKEPPASAEVDEPLHYVENDDDDNVDDHDDDDNDDIDDYNDDVDDKYKGNENDKRCRVGDE